MQVHVSQWSDTGGNEKEDSRVTRKTERGQGRK